MFDTEQLILLFKAGIATVTVDTPAASEPALIEKIALELRERYRVLIQWDCGNQFLNLTPRVERNLITKIDKSATPNVNQEVHPVITFIKHLEHLISEDNQPTLILAKDFLELVTQGNSRSDWLRLSKDLFFALKRSPHRLILTHHGLNIPHYFQDLVWELSNPLPTELEVEQLKIKKITFLSANARQNNIDFEVNLSEQQQRQLTGALQGMTTEGIEDALQLVVITNRGITPQAITQILEIKKQHLASKGVTFAPSPDVPVQGLPAISHWAQMQLPLLDATSRATHHLDQPAHVLFIGVSGTGKSLAVKAIAAEWGVPCLVLDLGKLMSKELGSSEANLRSILQQAEALAPCLLWIDEMDKQVSQQSSERDGGTSSRMIGTLLTWLEENKTDVIVAATANRPWGFSKEMLRRFKVFYVDLPNLSTRAEIWQVQLSHYLIELDSNWIQQLAERSISMTGAEIRNVVKEAATEAFALGHPRIVSGDRLLNLINSKPAQFRGDTEELNALRKWAINGGGELASPVSSFNSSESSDTSPNPSSHRDLHWN
ncbi:AAA family ATPase [Planktothrix sp. FACHB-1365]|uniref:AAA family ATPase n=1 Tax=Planktothrix sp. FACHB-1365 TaxID=2692855 RepID=UPI001681F743|nr:AAA family ATPase [Planktothrix sp. FACHB-1365]MBD2485618.1 AAA family ATPase [Planktothrix sp. FACHB-1365]